MISGSYDQTFNLKIKVYHYDIFQDSVTISKLFKGTKDNDSWLKISKWNAFSFANLK